MKTADKIIMALIGQTIEVPELVSSGLVVVVDNVVVVIVRVVVVVVVVVDVVVVGTS